MIIYAIDDLSNFEPVFHAGYGGIVLAYIKKRGKNKLSSIKTLDYVHGTQETLLSGKPCVVRSQIVNFILDEKTTIVQLKSDNGVLQLNLQDKSDKDYQVFKMQKIAADKKPFVYVQEGKLICLRKTAMGNSVVILR